MNAETNNRNYLTYRWLVGILIGLLIVGGGAFMAMRNARVSFLEESLGSVNGTVEEHVAKIAALEEAIQTLKLDTSDIKRDIKILLQRVK